MTAAEGTAVVTGAGGGLGRLIAKRLADQGYAVCVTDLDAGAAAGVAAEINASNPRKEATSAGLDVRDAAACREIARAQENLSLWVNNAGVLTTAPVWAQDDKTRALQLEVNAAGTINGTLAALEVFGVGGPEDGPDGDAGGQRTHGTGPTRGTGPARGHVLNVASLAALAPVSGEGIYAGSKHAVLGFSLSTAIDLRRAGHRKVRVSTVCPDGMWTPMLHEKLDDPEAAMSFSGVLLQPGEVADVVAEVARRPKLVRVVPRWRGLQCRLYAAAPSVAVRGAKLVEWVARAGQRRAAKRLRA
ncbi:SDR family NAD(P)-dependent oxidoreductase [Corynebacterium frankenforstense]